MPSNPSPEAAVRLYLMYLEDPAKLVDQSALDKAEAEVEKAKDPIDKLHALADLEHARRADGDQLRADFITQARAYADGEGIPASAFQQLGVADDDLREAGFDIGRTRARSRRQSSGPRAARVPLEQMKIAAHSLPKRFTLSDLADKAGGGSPATLRKAVDELIADGKAARIGPKEDYSGRGRAPTVYELR